MSRDKAYMQRRIDEAWARALECQQAATDDFHHAKYGDILAALESATAALALTN